MKIIVLSKTDYKEKDIIVNAISENELVSFKVRNGQVPTGPFTWLNNVLTIADVEFIDNPRYTSKILKNAKLLYTPLTSGSDYANYLAINLINEVVNKALPDEEKYLLFHEIENFFTENKNNNDLMLSEVVFLNKVARLAGYGLQVDGCIECGTKKDIVAFSFEEGGFICREHLDKEMNIDFTGQHLKLIRYLININHYSDLIDDKVNQNIDLESKKLILSRFRDFMDHIVGVHLNSIDLILKN